MAESSDRDQRGEIEVTPEMIEAGVYALRAAPLMANWRELVTDVYYAMETERLANERLGCVDEAG